MTFIRARRPWMALAMVGALVLGTAGVATAATLFGGIGGRGTLSDLLVLDPATGAVTGSRGPSGFGLTGLAVSPVDGHLYGVTTPGEEDDDRFLVRIDRGTGVATVIAPLIHEAEPAAIADISFTPDGTLYGWFEPSFDDLATIDLETAEVTVVGDSGLDTWGAGLAYDAAGERFIFAGEGPSGALHAVDPATGAVTELATLDWPEEEADLAISALAFGCDGTLYGALMQIGRSGDNPSQLITIDPTTGHITALGASANRLDAIAWDCDAGPPPPPPPPPAPEPPPAEPLRVVARFTG